MIAADTDLTPIDLGSYSSRVTFMAGNAALRAAEDVKKNIVSAAATAHELHAGRRDHGDRVWKRGSSATDSTAAPGEEAARGHVDGQILRGSVLQSRKNDVKDHMSFEEA